MTRDELIAKLQRRRNNDVIVYVPTEADGSITLQIEDVDYDEIADCILIDTQLLMADEVSFVEASDRRGFAVHVNGEQVGEEITYDDFGWEGIDRARKLVRQVAEALGGVMAK